MLGCHDRLGKLVRALDMEQKYIGATKMECDTTSRNRHDARTSGPRGAGALKAAQRCYRSARHVLQFVLMPIGQEPNNTVQGALA